MCWGLWNSVLKGWVTRWKWYLNKRRGKKNPQEEGVFRLMQPQSLIQKQIYSVAEMPSHTRTAIHQFHICSVYFMIPSPPPNTFTPHRIHLWLSSGIPRTVPFSPVLPVVDEFSTCLAKYWIRWTHLTLLSPISNFLPNTRIQGNPQLLRKFAFQCGK